MDCSMAGFLVHHQLPELAHTHVHQVGDSSNHLILCHPFILLPSIFPTISVFSNELALCIRCPKYWSFSISPSSEYSGLISFSIDWFDLFAQASKATAHLEQDQTRGTAMEKPKQGQLG